MLEPKPFLQRLVYSELPLVRMGDRQREAVRRFRQACKLGEIQFERTGCLCGVREEDAMLIAARDRFGLPVSTYLCPTCAVLWTSPRMTGDSLRHFYARYYRTMYGDERTATQLFFDQQKRHGLDILEFVTPHISDVNGMTVFDVGCAAGGVLLPFAARGARVAGCDYTQDYLQRGQADGLNLVHGDAERLRPMAPGAMIIASHVLEHCPDPLSELRRWTALLADSGYLYVEVPSVLNSYEMYGDLGIFLQNAHLYHFTLRTLTQVLSRAGLRLVRGNQTVRGLFIKSGDVTPIENDAAEVERILRYLAKREQRLRWMKCRRAVMAWMVRVADKTIGDGAVDSIKRLVQSRRL